MHPIRKYRLATGLSQTALARRIDVTSPSVARWEHGQGPAARHLPQLAQALGVAVIQLVEEIEAWRTQEK